MAHSIYSFPHNEDHDIFREALAYSEATTGLSARLIEKDYYCSLFLRHIFSSNVSIVFKGGTCLSKVYAHFYRLSEDIDMIIPVFPGESRDQRSVKMEPIKRLFDEIPDVVPGIEIFETFQGHNESRQYIACIGYPSILMDNEERIKVEVSLREPLFKPSVSLEAHTIAINPFTGQSFLPFFKVQAMVKAEAYSEKIRAALTRREPAIRDFFDIFFAYHKMKFDFYDPDFLCLAQTKLEIPGKKQIDISLERKQELEKQLDTQLKPVLRPADFLWFDLNEAFALVRAIATALQ